MKKTLAFLMVLMMLVVAMVGCSDGETPAVTATDAPVVDEPVADEPVADEPVADEPVADEPVVDEPVADATEVPAE